MINELATWAVVVYTFDHGIDGVPTVYDADDATIFELVDSRSSCIETTLGCVDCTDPPGRMTISSTVAEFA